MSSKETLTENMRRLSNIVNEAEQLNEDLRDKIGGGIQKAGKTAAGVAGDLARNVNKAMRNKQVRNSSVRWHENIEDLAISFRRELGEDPDQWAGKLKDYFAGLRQGTVNKIFDKNYQKSTYDWHPHRKSFAHRRMNFVMGQFDEELDQLVKACAKYAQDRYSVEPKNALTKTARGVIEKVKKEMPYPISKYKDTLGIHPRDYLIALYQNLADATDARVLPNRIKKFLAGLMAYFALAALGYHIKNTGPQED
jgi:hypothetical protein